MTLDRIAIAVAAAGAAFACFLLYAAVSLMIS